MDRWLLLISLILLLTLIVVAWKLVMKPREVEEVGEGETAKGPPALSLKACRGELVILYDNNPYDPRLETSWGFSCLLTLNETTILFDTGGDGRLLLRNMEKLGVDPREIDIIVLSHIHGDHVGGLDEVLEADGDAVVYLPASFPESFKGWVRDLAREVVEVEGPTVICGCAASTGPMRGGGVDEEALIINTPKGLVVVTGCAHPGVVRMVERAMNLTGLGVRLVVGGFHLSGRSEEAITGIVESFQRLGVEMVAPTHCSGDTARRLFQSAYGDGYVEAGVGRRIDLG